MAHLPCQQRVISSCLPTRPRRERSPGSSRRSARCLLANRQTHPSPRASHSLRATSRRTRLAAQSSPSCRRAGQRTSACRAYGWHVSRLASMRSYSSERASRVRPVSAWRGTCSCGSTESHQMPRGTRQHSSCVAPPISSHESRCSIWRARRGRQRRSVSSTRSSRRAP